MERGHTGRHINESDDMFNSRLATAGADATTDSGDSRASGGTEGKVSRMAGVGE